MTAPLASLQRVRHHDGEALLGRDFVVSRDFGATLGALHVLGPHATCGVALGLRVLLSADATRLLVCPGFGYDGHGRPLLLPDAVELTLPALPEEGMVLALGGEEPDPGVSSSPCPSLVRGRLQWRPPAEVQLAEGLPLAALRAGPDGAELDLAPRLNARPHVRPKIATGSYEIEITAAMQLNAGDLRKVDTRDASFTRVPIYLLHAEPMPRPVFCSIEQATADGFMLRLVLPEAEPNEPFSLNLTWMGVVAVDRCHPAPSPERARTAAGLPIADWASVWAPLVTENE